jgi:hypothetical protein
MEMEVSILCSPILGSLIRATRPSPEGRSTREAGIHRGGVVAGITNRLTGRLAFFFFTERSSVQASELRKSPDNVVFTHVRLSGMISLCGYVSA